MPPTPERLRLDYSVAMAMANTGIVRSVTAFGDATRGDRINSLDDAWRALYYEVEYSIRSLVGPDKYHDRFTIAIDINLSEDYPRRPPACRVVSRPMLWAPRVSQLTGKICIGDLGTSQKNWKYTLAQLILHLARLINFDEPPPTDGGLSAEAMVYWKQRLQLQCITKNLDYPSLPMHLLYPELASGPPKTPNAPMFVARGRRKT